MKKTLMAAAATAAAIVLALSACSQPTETPSSGPASSDNANAKFVGCMVSDQGGFDDKSFNQTSYAGLKKVANDFGITEKHVQSVSATDYATNVNAMVQQGCNIIIGVGFALADAVVAAAQANPDIEFAIVDDLPTDANFQPLNLPNLKPLVFNTNESSFLAGYLAASITQTGVVGTYGGQPYPTVTIFMDGFVEGVAYYNQQKGTSVKVLGWDVDAQDGSFVQSTDPFVDAIAGKVAAQNLTAQGADVLFPVAGNAGTGALQVAQESNGKISAIWVDTDGCVSAVDYCAVMPTSVYKGLDIAVYQAVTDALNNQFSADPFIGTLANGGTGIADFHQWDSKISDQTKAELDTIKAGIIDGSIKAPSKGAYTA